MFNPLHSLHAGGLRSYFDVDQALYCWYDDVYKMYKH